MPPVRDIPFPTKRLLTTQSWTSKDIYKNLPKLKLGTKICNAYQKTGFDQHIDFVVHYNISPIAKE